jgi:hypothetical protein
MPLVAFNVVLPGASIPEARALARSIRERSSGVRGVQALVFELPGGKVQLSMNLFRTDETGPSHVVEELERRGVEVGEQQVVGLCPARAANAAATGRLLEAHIAAAVALEAVQRCLAVGDSEHAALAQRLQAEGADLARVGVSQEELLGGAERAAALAPVLKAAGVLDDELRQMTRIAAGGLRDALSQETRSAFPQRAAALERRLDRSV